MGVYNYLSNLWVCLFLYFLKLQQLISLKERSDAVFQPAGVAAGDFTEELCPASGSASISLGAWSIKAYPPYCQKQL